MLYKLHARKCKRMVHRFHINTERNLLNNNSTSAFHRHVNSKRNASRGLAPSHNGTNSLINDADKACAYNKFFSSIFSPPNLAPPPTNLKSAQNSDEADFSPVTVFAALCKAKHTLSAGPDIVPSVFWTKLACTYFSYISSFYVIL